MSDDEVVSISAFIYSVSASASGAILPLQNEDSWLGGDSEHLFVTKRRKYEEIGKLLVRRFSEEFGVSGTDALQMP